MVTTLQVSWCWFRPLKIAIESITETRGDHEINCVFSVLGYHINCWLVMVGSPNVLSGVWVKRVSDRHVYP